MKKVLLSLAVILTFIFYSIEQRFGTSDEASSVIAPTSLPTSSTSAANSSPLAISNPTNQPNSGQYKQSLKFSQGSNYKNGSYTGDVADAYYGNIQVKAIISGGQITDVQFLQYPNDRRTSVEINSQAMPYLKQEAIQAQSANVDIISGATQSSGAFRQSLQTALDQAKI